MVPDVDVADLLRQRFAELDAAGDDASDQDDDLEPADGDAAENDSWGSPVSSSLMRFLPH